MEERLSKNAGKRRHELQEKSLLSSWTQEMAQWITMPREVTCVFLFFFRGRLRVEPFTPSHPWANHAGPLGEARRHVQRLVQGKHGITEKLQTDLYGEPLQRAPGGAQEVPKHSWRTNPIGLRVDDTNPQEEVVFRWGSKYGPPSGDYSMSYSRNPLTKAYDRDGAIE